MLRSDLCDFSDAYSIVKGEVLKTMLHLLIAYQKLVMY